MSAGVQLMIASRFSSASSSDMLPSMAWNAGGWTVWRRRRNKDQSRAAGSSSSSPSPAAAHCQPPAAHPRSPGIAGRPHRVGQGGHLLTYSHPLSQQVQLVVVGHRACMVAQRRDMILTNRHVKVRI